MYVDLTNGEQLGKCVGCTPWRRSVPSIARSIAYGMKSVMWNMVINLKSIDKFSSLTRSIIKKQLYESITIASAVDINCLTPSEL